MVSRSIMGMSVDALMKLRDDVEIGVEPESKRASNPTRPTWRRNQGWPETARQHIEKARQGPDQVS